MDILIPHGVPGSALGRCGRTDQRDWTSQIGRRSVQSFDGYVLSGCRIGIPREKLLGNIATVLGNDRYVLDRK
jgi:hypothetical protein